MNILNPEQYLNQMLYLCFLVAFGAVDWPLPIRMSVQVRQKYSKYDDLQVRYTDKYGFRYECIYIYICVCVCVDINFCYTLPHKYFSLFCFYFIISSSYKTDLVPCTSIFDRRDLHSF